MRISFPRFATWTFSSAFAAFLVVAPLARAQVSIPKAPGQTQQSINSKATELHVMTDVQTQTSPIVDAKEQKAYDEFFHAEDTDKKIQLGTAFLAKYPASALAEAVDSGLTSAYFDKQDWQNFYASADQALALKPDDVDVLTTLGWVIPHVANPTAPDAAKQLEKAEACEKRAMEVLTNMPKPSYLTDAQFAASKADKAIQAHSALGLVYFRRGDFANSVSELRMATDDNPHPDQTDLFVLGTDLRNLDRSTEAAEVFGRCGLIAGPLQDRCKQSAAKVMTQTAQPKP